MIRYTKTVAPFIEQGKTLRVGFQNVNLTASLLWDFFYLFGCRYRCICIHPFVWGQVHTSVADVCKISGAD